MNTSYQFAEPLTPDSFRNPPARFRGAPFWAWNGELDKEVMKAQMDQFQTMGFGGFHIHSRIGLSTEYLGREFMEYVKFCHEYAGNLGLSTYLYDEDKWPSGYGGGRVTKKEEFRARYLLFSPVFHEDGQYSRNLPPKSRLTEDGELKLIGCYQVELENGRLAGYRMLPDLRQQGILPDSAGEKSSSLWYAYRVITNKLPWFNNEAYADTLNPEAVKAFAQASYEPYYQALGEHFSGTVPSIFTDEPQFTMFQNFTDGAVPQETGIPFTDSLEHEFWLKYGSSLMEQLPEIFWERADGKPDTVRYQYLNAAADLFADSYAGTLGEWCSGHKIMLTGHLMEEGGLEKQARSIGDAMRCYQYFQMAGMDMLADQHEYTTAKQAQSVARQMGKPGLASEMYGVTNWDFDFRGHKLQGDWQAALGVTTRVPHLAWMYMGGESKRDYPAPIDSHSPWYERYKIIEDYFSRVGQVLTRGKAKAHICVIHPIESMFLNLGPDRDTIVRRIRLEENFQSLTKWLLFGLLDFDFLSEALLPKLQTVASGNVLQVGEMSYDAVIVPELATIRSATLDVLDSFHKAGGRILVMGNLPECVDGKQSTDAVKIMKDFDKIGFEKYALLDYMEEFREVEVTDLQGIPVGNLLYQLREEDGEKWLFLAHGGKEGSFNEGINHFTAAASRGSEQKIIITLNGNYSVILYDAMTGEIEEADYSCDGRKTFVYMELWQQDSVLLKLSPSSELQNHRKEKEKKQVIFRKYLPSVNSYTLEEPNVLLWDIAEYCLDEGEWQPGEEILKIDDIAREAFGYHKRTDSFPQPWVMKKAGGEEHWVTLRFRTVSEVEGIQADLAYEGGKDWELTFNGNRCSTENGEAFVDSCIRRISLGRLKHGENVLICRLDFGEMTNLEWFYLLGNFGVRLRGNVPLLEKAPEKIGFGDYAVQGFPFYGGNFCYETDVETPEGTGELEIGEYTAPLMDIQVDTGEVVSVFAAPYRVSLGYLAKGVHHIKIRCFGSRINMFGQLHNCNPNENYFGPKTWRTKEGDWCYEYRLHPCGIMKSPSLLIYTK